MASSKPAANPRHRIAPHVLVLCVVVVVATLAGAWLLPKLTAQTLLSTNVDSSEAYAFEARGDRDLRFFLAHTYPGAKGSGTNGTLVLRDSAGVEVMNVSAGVFAPTERSSNKGTTLFAQIPDFRPPEGTLTAIYTYADGQPSNVDLVIVEGGWIFRDGGEDAAFLILSAFTLTGFASVFISRPDDPTARGLRRFKPQGTTRRSLAWTLILGIAVAAGVLFGLAA